MDLLSGLNEKQRKAASHDKGPILVIAGAGTGKTRVLTHRIANLIHTRKARPSEILSITFTNKAAKEMKERIKQLIEYDVDRMWIGTFHSICVRILRRDIERLGYSNNFVIYDTDDQKNVVKTCIKELSLDPKQYNANTIRGIISKEKNLRKSPEKYLTENYSNYIQRNIGEIYTLYQKKLKECDALDFDDLILKALVLLEQNDDICKFYQDRFKYVLVDEYQDTNNVQYNLIKILAKKSSNENNIFVVGDDDQSIYGWRGADIYNILNFEKDFKDAIVVKLEKNYRSTNIILDASNAVIKNNYNRKGKELYTDYKNGEKIGIINTDNEKEEAFMIASNIKKHVRNENLEYSDVAILYRTNNQSRALEEGLMQLAVPYKIVGGLKFYGRKEIKDIMAYLNIIQNQKEDVSFRRIVNLPRRKVGPKALETLTKHASSQEFSLFEACYDCKEIGISPGGVSGIEKFIKCIEGLKKKKENLGLYEFINTVYEDSGYKKMVEEDQSIEGMSRLENIKEFLSAAMDFEERYEENKLEDFLAHVALLSDTDKTDDTENDRVTLLTVHSAKGLEFNTVFIAGLEEKIFPILRDEDTEDELEEERRLFYVASTRAKRKLFLSYADERLVFGHHKTSSPSRFIMEIPVECVDSPVKDKRRFFETNNYDKNKSKKGDFDDYFGGVEMSFSSFKKKDKNNSKKSKWFMGNSFIDDGLKVRDIYDDLSDNNNNLDNDNNIIENDTNFNDVKVVTIDEYSTNKKENTSTKTIKFNSSTKLKSSKICVGDKIKHKAWGVGTIVSIIQDKATIAFDEKGLKTVMLSFAPIQKI